MFIFLQSMRKRKISYPVPIQPSRANDTGDEHHLEAPSASTQNGVVGVHSFRVREGPTPWLRYEMALFFSAS